MKNTSHLYLPFRLWNGQVSLYTAGYIKGYSPSESVQSHNQFTLDGRYALAASTSSGYTPSISKCNWKNNTARFTGTI